MAYKIVHICGGIGQDYTVRIEADTIEDREQGIADYKKHYPTAGYGTRVSGSGRNLKEGTCHATIRRYHSAD